MLKAMLSREQRVLLYNLSTVLVANAQGVNTGSKTPKALTVLSSARKTGHTPYKRLDKSMG
jgi:hypothetical protein